MWSVTPRSSNSPRYPSIQLRNLFKTRYRWSGQLVAAKDDGFLRAGIKAAPHAWQPPAAQPDPRLYGGEWPAARCRETLTTARTAKPSACSKMWRAGIDHETYARVDGAWMFRHKRSEPLMSV